MDLDRDRAEPDGRAEGTRDAWDPSFAVFSLAYAGCGEAVIETRVGARVLLGWCAACGAFGAFGTSIEQAPHPEPRARCRAGGACPWG